MAEAKKATRRKSEPRKTTAKAPGVAPGAKTTSDRVSAKTPRRDEAGAARPAARNRTQAAHGAAKASHHPGLAGRILGTIKGTASRAGSAVLSAGSAVSGLFARHHKA